MALRVPCPQCGKFPPPPCDCPPLPPGPPDPPDPAPSPAREAKPRKRDEVIGLRREKRAGRNVIVIEGFPADVDLRDYARALKEECATGGTVKGGTLEIQGDHREAIEAFLHERGYRTKRTGG